MKIVALYSPSHKQMLDEYLVPSFPKDERLYLKTIEAPQLAGEKPTFNDPKWTSFMKIKAQVLYDELLSIPENDVYGFIDVDVIITQNFHDFVLKEIEGLDFISQSDSPNPNYLNCCTGVIFFRNTERCRNLLKAMVTFLGSFKQEQEAFTFFVANHSKYEELKNLKFKLFSKNEAFSYGLLNGQVWNGENPDFELPDRKGLYFVHANYAYHDQKIPLLEKFKSKL